MRLTIGMVLVGLMSALLLPAHEAVADRYEVAVSIRPIGGFGRFSEDVADKSGGANVIVGGGGGEVGFSYGMRNWLDVSAELAAAGFTEASYEAANVNVMGVPVTGRLTRTSRVAQLRAGASLRLGVLWVPTLYFGAGLGARMPSAATVRTSDHAAVLELQPDGMSSEMQLDACVVARVGIEHRIDRRWSVGVAVEASHTLGLGAATMDLASAGLSIAYSWYP